MKRRTILFVMNIDTADTLISAAAEAAAEQGHRLVCLILGASPFFPVYVSPYGAGTVPDNWSELVAEVQQTQQDRVQEVEALLAKSNAAGDVQSVICATADAKHAVARFARVCDEAYLADNLRDTPDFLREAASGVLFHSPIGLRINGSIADKIARVFVAWDDSEAAASALHAALPYLIEAKEVLIASIDPVMMADADGQDPGTDVAAWLSHHGCNVTVSQYPSGKLSIEKCIQDRAQEFGADLVVMGAYGHARMVQAVLGGTTRSMIEQTDLPVFLAH
ncbi:Nucleotide-binding universal stress protein, UspA family [Sulfitobacter marinus]|uniref:Nucleotide-binding universal stress protein, UspA family n=1 Tax=Sulfitobacter marinus TaxID=394264 RepID=A0A1I6QS83_9RHOB|nr:universal stress protein [Sulfitobacter marinus]SFS55250.1 Nucleotide-binding universal stress protein, UspA family [Sulfitobacter marinus]